MRGAAGLGLWLLGLLAGCGAASCPAGTAPTGWLGACCAEGQRAPWGRCSGAPTACPRPLVASETGCAPGPLPQASVVRVPAGRSPTGCDPLWLGRDCPTDLLPLGEQALDHDLAVLATEVSQALHEALTGANPSRLADCAACPVEHVSRTDAARAANALSAWSGLEPAYAITEVGADTADPAAVDGAVVRARPGANGWRLPTEAEWVHLARSGSEGPWLGAEAAAAVAWFDRNSPGRPSPGGQLAPNAHGVHDVLGNVAEWTDTVVDGLHVVRGGTFADPSSSVAAWIRGTVPPTTEDVIIGYRLVRTLAPGAAAPEAVGGP